MQLKKITELCTRISAVVASNFSFFSYFGTKIAKIKLGCYSTLSTSSPSHICHTTKNYGSHIYHVVQVWWKAEYGKSSGDHGTLAFFRSRLNRIAVTKELKKDVNACIGFISTVMKGHFLACACGILGVTSLDGQLTLLPGLHKASAVEQLTFINNISKIVVECCKAPLQMRLYLLLYCV